MALSDARIKEQVKLLLEYRDGERRELDAIRRYWRGRQKLPAAIPTGTPNEVKVMAQSSRVNVMPIVVNSLVQSMFVDGFRAKDEKDDLDVWDAWQANRMDARQTGIHRAAFAYGASYAIVLPGDTFPAVTGASPRSLTAVYGEHPDWPMWALQNLGKGLWRLFDDENAYYVRVKGDSSVLTDGAVEIVETRKHRMGVVPVVRFLDEDDLDAEEEVEVERGAPDLPVRGQIAPLMPLQDQIDLTTFSLQIAQHYGAFRQRWIIGWVAESEEDRLKASAAKVWTFDEDPKDMTLGEFEQSDVTGFIKSREASLRHAATLSQTPVHELIGELVNLSAEALAAAEAGRDRKVNERQTLFGESHEQVLQLVGQLMDKEIPTDAQVVWRDTSARAFAATIDGLGKIAKLLNVPPQELWERIPGVTKQDVERWKATAERGDSFQELAAMLERQSGEPAGAV